MMCTALSARTSVRSWQKFHITRYAYILSPNISELPAGATPSLPCTNTTYSTGKYPACQKRNAKSSTVATLTLHPEKLKFIDRMVADSRQVALNHTAGLSLPQQMQMSLFAAFSLLDKENSYKQKMQEIIRRRLKTLWDNTGFTLVEDPLRVGYYTEIDMLVWAEKFYGNKFVEYLKKTYSPLDVVFRLAKETSLVLLNGGGFDGPEWSVRASLANLNENDYATIGQGLKRILDEYAEEWKKIKN